MRLFYLAVAALLLTSCASSNNQEPTDLPNLVELHEPGVKQNQPTKIYIDSLKQAFIEQKNVLVVYGTFPDGCSNLQEVTHHTKNDSLYLEFTGWRNPELMCAQVLTPFTFIYDKLSEEEISSHSEVIINNSTYSY